MFSLQQNCLVSSPFFLRYGLSLDLVTIIIPCSLGNSYLTFGFLYHCKKKKILILHPIYTHRKIIKAPLLHQSLGPVSFFLSLWLSLSPSYHRLRTTRSWSIKGPQQVAPQNRDSGIRGILDGGTQDLLR